jgi:hypothetical protein
MTDSKEHLHYLKVLKRNYHIFQPEIRDAIDFSINMIEPPVDYNKLAEKLREHIICPACGLKLDDCIKKFGNKHKRFH